MSVPAGARPPQPPPPGNVTPSVRVSPGASVSPSAVVRGAGTIADGARVEAGAVLDGDFAIGRGTIIDCYAVVRGRVRIGPDSWIYPFCTIGTGPQHRGYPDAWPPGAGAARAGGRAAGAVEIGASNTIREYTTIHAPTAGPRTAVGSGCYILASCNVNHDCTVGDGATLASGTALGGHCTVGDGANLGFNVSVHPRRRIGPHSMVAMAMPVVRDVPPYALVSRQRFERVNEVGMRRAGMGAGEVADARAAYEGLAGGGGAGGPGGGRPGGRIGREIREFVESSEKGCYLPGP